MVSFTRLLAAIGLPLVAFVVADTEQNCYCAWKGVSATFTDPASIKAVCGSYGAIRTPGGKTACGILIDLNIQPFFNACKAHDAKNTANYCDP